MQNTVYCHVPSPTVTALDKKLHKQRQGTLDFFVSQRLFRAISDTSQVQGTLDFLSWSWADLLVGGPAQQRAGTRQKKNNNSRGWISHLLFLLGAPAKNPGNLDFSFYRTCTHPHMPTRTADCRVLLVL